MTRANASGVRPGGRLLALLAAAVLFGPAVASGACPPPPPRAGLEVVNPFITPYEFSAANATIEAYKGNGTALPADTLPSSLGALAAPFEVLDLAASDENRWHTDESDREGEFEWQAFVFFVAGAVAQASTLAFSWEGYGAFKPGENTYLLGYNFAQGRWDLLANMTFEVPVDRLSVGEIRVNVSDHVNGSTAVLLVASEEGPYVDLGNVGRPGGPPNPTTFIETDFVALRAYLPAWVASLGVPLLFGPTLYGQVTYRASRLTVEGNVTVAAGGTLTLDHATLIFNGTNTSLVVAPGGELRILRGSLVTDARDDTDDGGPLDRHYHIEVQGGADFYLEGSRIENAGVPGGSARERGLFLEGAVGSVCHAEFAGLDSAVVFDRVAGLSIEDLRVNGSGGGGPDLQLANITRLDALGLEFTSLAVSTDSALVIRTAIDVVVQDSTGKPIRGADLQMSDNGATIYASAGYGGADPRTDRATDFDDQPTVNRLRAVARSYLGSTTATASVTQISAKYFEWSQTRTVDTAAPHTEQFVMSLPSAPFVDEAASLGYNQGATPFSFSDSSGPGVALSDFNGDGRLDIFVAGGATRGEVEAPASGQNRLFRQEASGQFTDITALAGLASRGATAAAWGDLDNDGDSDLFLVYQGYGRDQTLLWAGQLDALYRNNGDGTFSNITQAAGVGDTGHGTSAAWGDFDGDGWLDLYVGNGGWVLGWLVRNETNTLYRNNHDGTFTDVTASMGVAGGATARAGVKQELLFLNGENATPLARDSPQGAGFTSAVAWLDYDRDGDLDLYVAEQFGSSVLYRNERGLSFTPVTAQAGLQKVGSARGVQVADLNGDGWLDIIQPNRWLDFVWQNQGDGTFADVAPALGLDEELPGAVPVPLDFDLDGRFDLFVASGRTTTFHTFAPSFLWSNRGSAGFADVTASAGVATGNNRTMGAASGDMDGDGRPDLVTANADRPGSLFLNSGSGGAWVKVRLQGTASPRDGQGAQVRLWAPGTSVGPVQQVGAVGARGSQQPNELLFALPGSPPSLAAPWRLEVLWSSGVRQVANVSVGNSLVTLEERASLELQGLAALAFPEDVPAVFQVGLQSSDPSVNSTALVEWRLPSPDGTVTLSGRSANTTFHTPGTFTGQVSVRDRTGTNVTASFAVQVQDTTTPDLSRLVDLEGQTLAPVALSAALALDNDPAFNTTGNFSWSFTVSGQRVVLFGREAQYTFGQAGSFAVTLSARDGGNNTATRTLTVRVGEPQGIGLREVAIGLLVAAAALIAALTILRARRAKQSAPPPAPDETHRPGAAPPEGAPAKSRPPTKRGGPK